MEKPSTFANRLNMALEHRQITKAELARLSGLSKSSITRYAKGDWEAKQDAVYAIAQALNVNEAWLMGYDAPMERVYSELLASIAEDNKSGRTAAVEELRPALFRDGKWFVDYVRIRMKARKTAG